MPSHSYDILARLSPRVPAAMAELAARRPADAMPSVAVPAASVALLRDREIGLETYLLHRHARMPFAPSTVVFPGGRVDPADHDDPDPIGPNSIRRCAIRETAEETGVVLAEVDLHPWAHWITPEIEPRRYDTWFFAAVMPADLEAADISGETERAEWSTPREAIAAERSGVIRLMPPTMSILIELADLGSVEAVIKHAPRPADRGGAAERGGNATGLAISVSAGSRWFVVSYVQLLRAPNPGPMTLDGTNTWVITDADEGALVIDPGPAISSHLDAVFAACEPRLLGIVLTHRHLDHSEGAALLAERAGCGVRAADPEFRIGVDGLAAGELLILGSITLEVVETPGHTSDSRSLLVFGPDGVSRLITGDMVLGRGTTVITYPDGDLAAYLESLDLLGALVTAQHVAELLPGHGPIVNDPIAWLTFYRRHRLERLDQVRAALAAGDRTPSEVVARVYADVDRSLWPAAEQSVRSQLEYLERG